MARMVPSPMAGDVESEAERLLYRKFETETPADLTVIHQARWVGRRDGLAGRDGEADFVVLDPARGVLVLEAKGGRIAIDGRTGRWVQRQGKDERVLDRSPFAQASDSKHVLLERIRTVPLLRRREVHAVHAVAFPDVTVPRDGLGPEGPRERILDAVDLQSLTGWLRRCFASADRARPDLPPLGPDGVEAIVDLLVVRRTLRLHAPSLAARVEERLGALTEQQFQVLHLLAHVPRAQVCGGPGTGKTLLAIEAARRFAAQGLDTLLVCFNAPLGGFLAGRTRDLPRLAAGHFHGVARTLAAEAGLEARIAAAEAAPGGYENVFPEILLDAAERLGRRYDAVVVDEAQDFRGMMWAALEGCLREGVRGNLYLFEDPGQTLAALAPLERPANLQGPFHLTRACRSPDEILAFLVACPGGPTELEPSGVLTGIRPRVTWAEDPGKVARVVSGVVARLVKDSGVPPGDIVVLTPRAAPRSALGRVDRLGPAPVSWRERESGNHVLVDTIHRFKGLEAPAVVLAEIAPDVRPDLPTCLRVGASRPTVHLELVASPSTAPLLEAALAFADVS